METRARYALIGLFMLAVIAASFAFVYWLENKGGFAARETYNIRFQSSVSGLLVGSAVLFNGIRVGEVTGLTLNPDAPQNVVATIAVANGTPIRSDTTIATVDSLSGLVRAKARGSVTLTARHDEADTTAVIAVDPRVDVVIVKPAGTGTPSWVISASPIPLPPSSSRPPSDGSSKS